MRRRARRGRPRPARRGAAEPLLALLGAHRRPRPGAGRPAAAWPTRSRTATALLRRARRRRGHRDAAALASSAPARRSATTCCRHPEHWRELTDPTLGSHPPGGVRRARGLLRGGRRRPATPPTPVATLPDARGASTRCGWSTAGCCCGSPPATSPTTLGVDDVAAELSDLAAGTLDAALAVARARVGEAAAPARLAVIAMGKCGGHELNYVSDVDVIFVAEPADGRRRARGRCGPPPSSRRTLMQVCSDHTAEGTIWPVDAACAPRASPARWCARWPATAATTSAGPRPGSSRRCSRPGRSPATSTLGQEYVDAGRADGVVGGRARRLRRATCRRCAAGSSSTSRPREAERQLKLGSGGLRDVEFAVQLLQLVHGRADESVRAADDAERAGRADRAAGTSAARTARRCTTAYAFLRTLEHRIQLYQLRRTHVVPDDEASLRRLGRSHGLRQGARSTSSTSEWQPPPPRGAPAAREALLPAAARGGRADARRRGAALARGGRAAARGARLRRPEGRAAPPRGADQRASPAPPRIQRTLLPAMLEWFADAPDPDAGLFGFRRISRGARLDAWYLQTLRDEGAGRRAAGAGARHHPLRHRPARARARRACGCSARRDLDAAGAGRRSRRR